MATFASVQNRIRSHVLDLPSATQTEIPNWINEAIRDAQQRHNFRAMETSVERVTTTLNHDLGVIPEDYKERRGRPWLRRDKGTNIQIDWSNSEEQVIRMFAKSHELDMGKPFFVHEKIDGFEVYPFPDGGSDHTDGEYRINIPYWRYLPDLEEPDETNWFLDNGERYIINYAAAQAFTFNFAEDRAATRLQVAENELVNMIRQSKRSRSGRSSVLVPLTGVHGHRWQRRL